MAQMVQVILTDDMDGGEGAETVNFGLDGKSYEIDLNTKNAEKLRKSLAPYVDKGRRSGNVTSISGRRRRDPSIRDYDIGRLRAWATQSNVKIPSRGRIPQEVIDQYKASGN